MQKKCAEKFALLSFQDSDIKNAFFGPILYGLLFELLEDNKVSNGNIKDVLEEEFFDKFMKERDSLQLDDSLEGFFKKCHLVNNLLETKGLFLRVYERRDKLDTS